MLRVAPGHLTEIALTPIGFLRGHTMNVYAGEHRLALAATATQG
ncbi:hypothetical protein [Streptomyces sp. NPDC005303]